MNYKRIYSAIIKNRLSNPLPESEYGQKHHILPKSLYPDKKNDPKNIVKLSYREHYVCHWLLTKIYPCKEMTYAFYLMNCYQNKMYINSHAFQMSRKAFNEINRGKRLSDETKTKMSEAKKGKHLSEETKKKLSEASKWQKNPNFGKHHSDEIKKKISDILKTKMNNEKNPFYGRHHSEETKKKMSESRKEANKGKIWINNGIINKFVYPDEIPEGFVKGRLKNKQIIY